MPPGSGRQRLLEPRLGPQEPERGEGHDEHDPGGEEEQRLRDRQVRALDQAVRVRALGAEQERSDGAGPDYPVSAAAGQRRMAKKTWTPLLQRKIIAEPLKSLHLKPAGLRLDVR